MALAGDEGVLYARQGLVLAGRGEAARLELAGGLEDEAGRAAAAAWLAAVPLEDEVEGPGTGVVAHGALPFDRTAAGTLIVPAVTYGADAEGSEWVTVVGRPPAERDGRRWRGRLAALTRTTSRRRAAAGTPAVHPVPPPEDYEAAVASAVAAIGLGELQKVVLGRSVVLDFRSAPDTAAALRRLREDEPACAVFSRPVPGGVFLGASPELLVARRGHQISAQPVAGTAGNGREDPSRLLQSAKDRWEHQLVVDEISRALAAQGAVVDVPPGPELMALHSVVHLATRIEARLPDWTPPQPTVLDLLAALHPTPAVGGVPRSAALELMAALEAGPRGLWAGPVGWVDGQGDGEWVIGIRSATVSGRRAVLWAGAGIVADSVPAAELAETTLKLVPVIEALSPGGSALLGSAGRSS